MSYSYADLDFVRLDSLGMRLQVCFCLDALCCSISVAWSDTSYSWKNAFECRHTNVSSLSGLVFYSVLNIGRIPPLPPGTQAYKCSSQSSSLTYLRRAVIHSKRPQRYDEK